MSALTATTATEFTTAQDAALAKVRALGAALDSAFIDRSGEIRALLVALLAEEHLLLLGPPGTAKSALVQTFAKALGGRYFQRLLTKFSLPKEVFGPTSIKALREDRSEFSTDGYLPTADVAFVDECFKANSAILNALLTILNERGFDNGTRREACPLKVCVGASNELPNNEEGDSLDALYDRFVLRRWVEPLKSRESRRRLLRMKGAPSVAVRLDDETLSAARRAVDLVELSEAAEDAFLDLVDALASECGIEVTDRRARKSMKLLRAYAALQGRTEVVPEDLEILADSLWNAPEERAPVMGQIMKVSNPAKAEAAKVYDAAVEAFSALDLSTVSLRSVAKFSGTLSTLKEMRRAVEGLSDHPSVQAIASDIKALENDVARAVAKALEG